MYPGLTCIVIFAALDGRTSVDNAKATPENQINDVEGTCGDSNHFEPIFCSFVLMF